MPSYYFDVFDGERLWTDEFGEDLADLYEAKDQARALLRELAREKLPAADDSEVKVVVRCSGGRCRYEASLSLKAQWIEPPTYPPRA